MSGQLEGADVDGPRHTNRLIHETSPYLLQHAHNPVDWYPWGEEAFARARAEDRPVLLSVGYAACHWCHVMAHESFEDEEIARLINEHFVAIKVDREERPDVDALYMEAVQRMTGGGGWPMTVFLTPDGAPFYGGTYYPPRDRYGMPSFPTVLRRIAELYRTRRADVERTAADFRDLYRREGEQRLTLPADLDPATARVDPGVLEDAADRLLARVDAVDGGFGRAPKFPQPAALEFLLRVESRRRAAGPGAAPPDPRLMLLVRLTLDRMADGGIYDQVGGGFHRYATDAHWLVPHFEKMLYDNAQLARTYLAAWQLDGEPRYRRICEETLDFVLREMTDPAGGFYATQDADSEGEEGRFYLWDRDELARALDPADLAVVEALWGVSAEGNFEGRTILHVARPLAEVAGELGITDAEARAARERARAALYARRAARVWPGRDDKVIAGWNGLMLRAMAEAGRLLDRPDYRAAAEGNAGFLLSNLVVDGRLRRTWRAGRAGVDAYLEDHAALVNGLLSVYEATGTVRWFVAARRLADEMLDRFWDPAAEGFFDTAGDQERLIGRPRELTDGATPSGMSLAAEALLRLAAFTGEGRYREHASRVLLALGGAAAEQPLGFGHLLCALDDLVGPLREIAVVGPRDDPATGALLAAAGAGYRPRAVLAVAEDADRPDAEAAAVVPLLADRPLVGGRPTAYVCEGFACRLPVTDPDALAAQLDAPAAG